MNINKNGKTGATETDAQERTPSLDCMRMRIALRTCPIAYRVHVCTTSSEDSPLSERSSSLSVYGHACV